MHISMQITIKELKALIAESARSYYEPGLVIEPSEDYKIVWFTTKPKNGTADMASAHKKYYSTRSAHGGRDYLVVVDNPQTLETPEGPKMLVPVMRQGNLQQNYSDRSFNTVPYRARYRNWLEI